MRVYELINFRTGLYRKRNNKTYFYTDYNICIGVLKMNVCKRHKNTVTRREFFPERVRPDEWMDSVRWTLYWTRRFCQHMTQRKLYLYIYVQFILSGGRDAFKVIYIFTHIWQRFPKKKKNAGESEVPRNVNYGPDDVDQMMTTRQRCLGTLTTTPRCYKINLFL